MIAGQGTCMVILDALGLDTTKASELATIVRRAIRANNIANSDDYTNQLIFIRDMLKREEEKCKNL